MSGTHFFRKILDLIAQETWGTLICAGDFNILLHPSLDTTNIKRGRNSTEKRIKRSLKDLVLSDVWRFIHGTSPGYTFYSARHAAYSRLDYYFMFNKDLH